MEMDNKYLVSVKGDEIIILRPVEGVFLKREDAINLATWLLVLADTTPAERKAAIDAVEGL